MGPLKIGSILKVDKPARGSLVDWAVAGGKFAFIRSECKQIIFLDYKHNMMVDLVFVIDLGPENYKQLGSDEALSITGS